MEINPETGKDKYLTDPVRKESPLPVEPQDVEFSDVTHTCTLSVRCNTFGQHRLAELRKKWAGAGRRSHIPCDDRYVLRG